MIETTNTPENVPSECTTPCGLNHCDTNGCSNRKRHYVAPDEVVKDLEYFMDQVAKTVAKGIEGEKFESYDDLELHFKDKTGQEFMYVKCQLEGLKLFHKYQLEEKDRIFNNNMKGAKSINDQLKATIEEQRKEIDKYKKALSIASNEIEKLTQENEALKQK